MKTIQLKAGYETMVDDSDYEYLSKEKWYLSRGYAIDAKLKKMHRVIMKPKKEEIIDHIDRNPLNNTRANLRIVTKEQNVHNQRKRLNTINNYKGVNYDKRIGLYGVRCNINGSDYFLGHYTTEIAAGYAYNKKAKELTHCALLNEFNLPANVLEEMLINDFRTIRTAEKQNPEKGVYWNKQQNKWNVKIGFGGKYVWIGVYKKESDAVRACKTARRKLNKK